MSKFNTMSRALNSVFLYSMMTSQLMQHGGRPPFWKIIISLYLSRESSEYDEIWYADAYFEFDPGDGNVRKFQKFPNSRRQTDAILKIIFWL